MAISQPTVHRITIDWSQKGDSLRPIWSWFGYDEPNYTYMKDGKKLLTELAALSHSPVYVRCHNLLTTGDGQAALKWGSTNAYTEDASGNPIYNWTLVDSIFDTYVSRGMKPLVEIGFTPEALSVHPKPYRHHWKPGVPYDSVYTGWAWPPSNYEKYGELVYRWVKHCVSKYGQREVESWLWEVWNEPNIGYWKGTKEEYFKLYDYAADAVKRALPSAKVGGPATTGPGWDKAAIWLQDFLIHCHSGRNAVTGAKGSPLDLITFHAKGSPRIVEGHVQMNMSPQLKDVEKGCTIVSQSAFKDLPIYITECDPEGCAACGMTTNPENSYRNGTMYSSYTAASFTRIYDLAAKHGVNLQGAISWSFEFENQRWFDGFRDLATNGVDKPVLNVFRMFGMMQGRRVAIGNESGMGLDSLMACGVRGTARDVNALAVLGDKTCSVMAWNYSDEAMPGEATMIQLSMTNLPFNVATLHTYVIDEDHSNAYTIWKRMGMPQSPDSTQIAQLEKSGMLAEVGVGKTLDKKHAESLSFMVPLHGVILLQWR